MIYILLVDNQKGLKTLSRPLNSRLKKIMEFKDFSGTSPKLQEIFKTVKPANYHCCH